MGGSSTTLSIVLKLIDEASAAMDSVGAKLESVGKSMTSAGRTLTTDVTLPLVGIGFAATKAASDFEAAMTQLVTQAGLPADQLKRLTDEVQAFADSGAQQTPEVLAQGLYHIVSLGVPAAHAMDVLKLASEGAAMSGANLEDVANALGAAVASNIKGSGDYQNAMATLNATVGAGNMRMGDLAVALGNVLPQATTAGLSLKDVGAAMATMTDNGMPAADAATRLHMAIALMAAPTQQATKALESIGITQLQLADDMRNKGMLAALTDLHDHLVDAGLTANQQGQILSEAFGGGRTSGAIELLLNNLDRVGQKYDLIDSGVNKFGTDVQIQSATAAAKFAEAQAQMSDAMIRLGAALLPLIETVMPKLVAAVTALVNWFTNLPAPVQNGILIFLALLAVLGPVLVIVGSLISVVGMLITVFTAIGPIIMAVGAFIGALSLPVLLVIGLFGLLAYIVATRWNDIKTGTQVVWDAIKASIKAAVDYVVGIVQTMFDTVMGIINKIISAANSVGSAVSHVAGNIGTGFSTVVSMVPHFAAGGIVTGPTLGLIGEAGPEAIVPLSQLGGLGGPSINITITGNTISSQLDLRGIAQAVSAEIVRTLRMNQKVSV